MSKIVTLSALLVLASAARVALAGGYVPKCEKGEAYTATCDFAVCVKFLRDPAAQRTCCEKNLVFACVPSEATCAEARRTRRQCDDRATEDGLCDLARRTAAASCAGASEEVRSRCASARATIAHPSCASSPPRLDCGVADRILSRCPSR